MGRPGFWTTGLLNIGFYEVDWASIAQVCPLRRPGLPTFVFNGVNLASGVNDPLYA